MRLASLLACLLLAPHLSAAQDTAEPSTPTSTAPRVRVVTTAGNFVIELDRNRAPLTVDAFLKYTSDGFYAGVVFHRVVPGFIAQAGGFTPDMQPKPVTENIFNESGNGLSNLRGTVGLARSTEPHSGTSQFYVNLADNVDLDPRPTRWGYAVFGKVVGGMDVVEKIAQVKTGVKGMHRDVPVETVKIERVEIV